MLIFVWNFNLHLTIQSSGKCLVQILIYSILLTMALIEHPHLLYHLHYIQLSDSRLGLILFETLHLSNNIFKIKTDNTLYSMFLYELFKQPRVSCLTIIEWQTQNILISQLCHRPVKHCLLVPPKHTYNAVYPYNISQVIHQTSNSHGHPVLYHIQPQLDISIPNHYIIVQNTNSRQNHNNDGTKLVHVLNNSSHS